MRIEPSLCIEALIRLGGGVPIGADRDPRRTLVPAMHSMVSPCLARGPASVLKHNERRLLIGVE